MSEKVYYSVTEAGSIANGKCTPYIVNGRSIVLVNLNDEYFCIEDLCSHAESPLSSGRIRGGKIFCPLHGARFDVKTGEHLGPPATRGIETFDVRVVDGMIEAAVTPKSGLSQG